ncbi:MAG: lamin tail domain-containing protein, partial [Verrucomicrobiota bacterium]|nr:lamin tail domain-containing protein [Verrucomicrobiota bacterium]
MLCSSARGILISEVQSWNRSTLKDQRGEYPDWIELWNPGPEAASLHGLFLSDQRNRLKYPLPPIELDPGEYHLVFASGEPEVAGYAPFSISSEGEPVYLLNAAGQLLDWVEVPESQPDLSHGR